MSSSAKKTKEIYDKKEYEMTAQFLSKTMKKMKPNNDSSFKISALCSARSLRSLRRFDVRCKFNISLGLHTNGFYQ
jgi:hypothetical protein